MQVPQCLLATFSKRSSVIRDVNRTSKTNNALTVPSRTKGLRITFGYYARVFRGPCFERESSSGVGNRFVLPEQLFGPTVRKDCCSCNIVSYHRASRPRVANHPTTTERRGMR